MKSLLAMVAVSALLLGACNSDDSTGDGPSSSAGAGSPSGAGAGGGGSGVDGASGGAGGGQGDGESPGDGGAGAAGEGGSAASAGEGGSDVGPVDTTLRTYAADDKNIQLTGRVDWSDPKKPRFSAPGVQIQARFKGVSVAVTLRDEHKWDKYFNYFDVIVDDGEAKKIQVLPDVKDYEIASNLPNGEHTVTVVKRTEAAVGYTEFLGFKIGGEIVAPPARPTRRIEFIGDSISCGSGIEAPNGSEKCNEDEWGQPYHNARLAFGPVVARELGAEAVVTAVSGIGLVRNYSFMYDARPMPEVYGLTFLELEDSPAWDRARFVPDAVVIALGTNDFSPGDSEREKMDPATYADAYIDFVGQLRSYYPDAHVFCLSSPMLGDGWPEATDMSATDLKTALTNVEEHFAGLGDAKVHKLFVPKMSGKGCGTHPDASEHAEIAKVVAPFIKSTMGW